MFLIGIAPASGNDEHKLDECHDYYSKAIDLMSDINTKVKDLDYETDTVESVYALGFLRKLESINTNLSDCVDLFDKEKYIEVSFYLVLTESSFKESLRMFAENRILSRLDIVNGIITLYGNTTVLLNNAKK